ncbi:hypothetical protein Pmar_PMAR024700 [Perkinsus marinus ATCC 50983]|uniref:Uncharacterized protein n=1 Tax=Perkinsus marinus (strain ATCC 50983 / TXsc) TaxID=423536 RepID=C5M129_PERM5|nr:hypothetical protein Pmar_PMAR024700 [Perkinsus marinus ATCC 50983]EEQ97259.1 hypothetical protein Pmar_PMAR024700 [Perkinsus marinus ATCC 50983]|eukprot:XP_002764542.1 hypothetical protein Pmar_PMAR024700 [Perkinsus marinus ATCC 50983]
MSSAEPESDSELLDSWAGSAVFDEDPSLSRRATSSRSPPSTTSRVSAFFTAGRRAVSNSISATGALIKGLSESLPEALAGPEPATPEVEEILLHLRQLLAELLLDMSGSADASSVTVGILSDIRVKKCLDEAVLATTFLDELADALLDIWYVSRFDDGVLSSWSPVSQTAWLQQLLKVTVGADINNSSVINVRLAIHLLISAVYQLGMAIMAELEASTFDRWRSSMVTLLERVENLDRYRIIRRKMANSCGDKAAGSIFFSQLAFIEYYDDSVSEAEEKPKIFKLDVNWKEGDLISRDRASRRSTLIPSVGDAELETQTRAGRANIYSSNTDK